MKDLLSEAIEKLVKMGAFRVVTFALYAMYEDSGKTEPIGEGTIGQINNLLNELSEYRANLDTSYMTFEEAVEDAITKKQIPQDYAQIMRSYDQIFWMIKDDQGREYLQEQDGKWSPNEAQDQEED